MDTVSSMQTRLWQDVGILALALVIVFGTLVWPLLETAPLVFLLSVLAGTSGILLAMSFSLSSFSYYYNFLDSKVVYRKQLGLMGYFFALAYALVAIYRAPDTYLNRWPENMMTVEVGLGAVAMIIFTIMALISNAAAVQWLGAKTWKSILGLGYIAYALLVIRGILLDAALWTDWFMTQEGIFTVRMFLTMLGIAVLLFRVSVPFHKKYIKKDAYV